MAEGETRTVTVRVRGRVQGVGFRFWTARQAERLGLAGWVRNRLDGSVEALFRGSPAAVEAMLGACREGPRSARVDEMAVRAGNPASNAANNPNEPVPAGFQQLPTV